jgi:hypothetical protein
MKTASFLLALLSATLCATALCAWAQDASDSATKSKIIAMEGAWNQAYKSGDEGRWMRSSTTPLCW